MPNGVASLNELRNTPKVVEPFCVNESHGMVSIWSPKFIRSRRAKPADGSNAHNDMIAFVAWLPTTG